VFLTISLLIRFKLARATPVRCRPSGDIGLKSDETSYTYSAGEADLQYAAVSAYDGDEWDAVLTMAAAATDDLVVLWDIPTSADNTIQGDSLSFDISFVLEQAAAD
jgi:hypothetical protein